MQKTFLSFLERHITTLNNLVRGPRALASSWHLSIFLGTSGSTWAPRHPLGTLISTWAPRHPQHQPQGAVDRQPGVPTAGRKQRRKWSPGRDGRRCRGHTCPTCTCARAEPCSTSRGRLHRARRDPQARTAAELGRGWQQEMVLSPQGLPRVTTHVTTRVTARPPPRWFWKGLNKEKPQTPQQQDECTSSSPLLPRPGHSTPLPHTTTSTNSCSGNRSRAMVII